MTGCPRCHNLVVREIFVDCDSPMHIDRFWGWRCVICGDIFDPLILAHRMTRPEPTRCRSRRQPSRALAWRGRTTGSTARGKRAEE